MCGISNGWVKEEGIIVLGKEFFKPIDRHNCNKRASITKQDIIDREMTAEELLDLT